MDVTIYCKILVIRECQYTDIVVEDLNRDVTDDLKYVTVVKTPNWEAPQLNVGDVGYLQFQSVQGGKSKWFNKDEGDFEIYKYTNNYFLNFFKEKDECKLDKFDFE